MCLISCNSVILYVGREKEPTNHIMSLSNHSSLHCKKSTQISKGAFSGLKVEKERSTSLVMNYLLMITTHFVSSQNVFGFLQKKKMRIKCVLIT